MLLLTERQPTQGWSSIDKKLAVALQILEDETCSDCGVPVWLGHSDDKEIQFEIKSRVCYACAAVEAGQEKESTRKGKRKTAKGIKRFIATNLGSKIPTRDKYYSRLQGDIDEEE